MTPRLFFATDIHLKISEAAGLSRPFEVPDADVCVIAGDVTDRMLSGMEWVAKTVGRKMPVVMTLGNHDLYGQDMPAARRKAPARARDLGIHLLEDSEAEVCGVRFVGGTLWTDFRLFESLQDPLVYTKDDCIKAVRNDLADYVEIYANEVVDGVMSRTLTPRDTIRYHERTVAYLDEVLARPFDGPTVVVTHYAPHPRSIHQRFLDRPSSAAYASDLTWLMERHKPEFWLHGHVHDSFDYVVDETRILCNPRGYGSFPNLNFNPSLVIDVARRARLRNEVPRLP
ncbi:metallophosphoesterase [Pararhizobium sp. BT-229]|uniref:metallophosphoesterase n=1 Tax=Pararhizobium sp. BT-229 TaxID=2986923 RepID=UPI0021F7FE61|nr:metallophosphoesterase [Pararhizobium sp. BT-229]MCV9964596.1 metallophosphoesterase [Pararhizobium sp. BT-229]